VINYKYILASCAECQHLTQTVYGFLDFTTTIGNTVMVFSPQSSPDPMTNKTTKPLSIIETRPHSHKNDLSKSGINPTPLFDSISKEESRTFSTSEKSKPITVFNTPEQTLGSPEYALLSRQPEEFAEESFRVINLKTRAEGERQRNYQSKRDNSNSHSIGVHSRKGDDIIKNSLPSGVLGTKTPNKYLQASQSVTNTEKRIKPRHSSSTRLLKNANSSIHPSKISIESASQLSGYTKSHRKNNREPNEKRKSSRHKGKRRQKNTISSSVLITPSLLETSSRRSYRTKTSQQSDEIVPNLNQNTLMLNRRPGRWQYKSSPKPKVNIRKASANTTKATDALIETPLVTDEKNQIQKAINLGRDLDAVGSQNTVVADEDEIKPKSFLQTLNVEISTPSDFNDVYYEIATIKSPFIFQAGVVKKTRFLTVTSTIEKKLKSDPIEEYSADDGPLTENILDSTVQMNDHSLDGSITTLKAIYITDSPETPELDTITESFSITQTKLKTQILPIILEKKNETIQITLVQTYDYTSFITVTQTIFPLKDNFSPSKNFKDFSGILDEAGSEINLDLDFADEGNFGQYDVKPNRMELKGESNSTNNKVHLPLNKSDPLNISENPIVNVLSPMNSVVTSTRPIIKLETIWESYVVPLVRGTDSILRTLSKSIGVVEKTEYATEFSTILSPMSHYPYSLNPFYNPLLPIPPQQLITSTSIFETLVTETSSKVLKLTFGARTAYTTIFSTMVVPTGVTKLITATLPVQNTGSFPNYFPPPYPPFAYVG
ncbi:hypothetical protein KR222_004879, partial [Zaprionus bogoriensis]